ncbi:MAG: hypothetical protein GY842_10435 [bacterium]|nr:hypothetical protein [bacterium]
MYQSDWNRGGRRARRATVSVLLVGAFGAWAYSTAPAQDRERPDLNPAEAESTPVAYRPANESVADPNAGLIPLTMEDPNPPLPWYELLPPGAGPEDLFGLRSVECPCTDIGRFDITFPASSVFRGNWYRMDPDGSDRKLCEFKMELILPTGGADLCFLIYKRNSGTGIFARVLFVNQSPTVSGRDFYSSGTIDYMLEAGEQYALAVAWGNDQVTFGLDNFSYPLTVEAFGTVMGSFGLNSQTCETINETLVLSLISTGVYSQELCFEPKPGACCYDDGGVDVCADTVAGGGPMDRFTCINDEEGEFTNSGVTCADLEALDEELDACEWLYENQGSCCLDGTCTYTNPFFCELLEEEVSASTVEFHVGIACETEVCDPRGTCCAFDGTCLPYRTESECEQVDGRWYDPAPLGEPDVICTPELCTARGACCIEIGGLCLELSEAECALYPGTYTEDGQHCDPGGLVCELGAGACCLPEPAPDDGYVCSNGLSQYECEIVEGGTNWIPGFTCGVPVDPCLYLDARPGACCMYDIGLPGVACRDDLTTNGCHELTVNSSGLYPIHFVQDYQCEPDTCRNDFGACCVNGECLVTTAAECAQLEGVYDDSTGKVNACDNFDCPDVGACCLDGGGCQEISSNGCENSNGVFAGVDVPCGWACNRGACCRDDVGDCEPDMLQLECLAYEDAEFRGAFTECDDGMCRDCNTNGLPDAFDIAGATSTNCNSNGDDPLLADLADECEIDENSTAPGGPYLCVEEPACNRFENPGACVCDPDCNNNGVPDWCDVDSGDSTDINSNGVPDECEDCNDNGIPDACDLSCLDDCSVLGCGESEDCDLNGIPDECTLFGCKADLTFVLDTSGSMSDEIEMLCSVIDGVIYELARSAQVNLSAEILTIWDGARGAGEEDNVPPAGGARGQRVSCSCCTGSVALTYGTTATGLPEVLGDCSGNGVEGEYEDWAPATAIISANKVWETDAVRVAIPISDEGPRCGSPVNDPGDDRVAVVNASLLARQNVVVVSPVLGTDFTTDIVPLAQFLANNGAPGGLVIETTVGDLAANLIAIVDSACTASRDCNGNGIPDTCDIAQGTSADCNSNGFADECEEDCNINGTPDDCDIATGFAEDCNSNGFPDSCDIDEERSSDCQPNGTPDECEPDCNTNGIADDCDIGSGTSLDCQLNGTPDECEPDCNSNGVADECDIDPGTSVDCNSNGTPDECEADCNTNGIADECDIAAGTSNDCNANSTLDECETYVRSDFDLDGDVDLADFAAFQDCMAGPETSPEPYNQECVNECLAAFDYDDDLDVDLRDYGEFTRLLETPRYGDYDGDNDVDLADHHELVLCLSGPYQQAGYSAPSYQCHLGFDFDADTDVDLNDCHGFMLAYDTP